MLNRAKSTQAQGTAFRNWEASLPAAAATSSAFPENSNNRVVAATEASEGDSMAVARGFAMELANWAPVKDCLRSIAATSRSVVPTAEGSDTRRDRPLAIQRRPDGVRDQMQGSWDPAAR